MKQPSKPSALELAAAEGRRIADVIAPGLDVLFCGINPSLYSAATGCHFGRPGNRFWPALARSGFTDGELAPWQTGELLAAGLGITNVVARATRTAAELSPEELRRGGRNLERKTKRHRPRVLAVLGVVAYRQAFGEPEAAVGPQQRSVGDTPVWVLPNPSGLNAHYQLDDLARLFRKLRHTARRR